MKKFAMVVLSFLVVTAFSAPSQAFMRKDMALVKGRVVSFDAKKKVLIVESEAGEGKITLDVSSAEITTSTKAGERVVAIYKVAGNGVTIVKPVPPGR